MAGVPPKHLTSSKVRRRRSHHALKPVTLNVCPACKHPVVPHRACSFCGVYRSKKVAVKK